MLNIERLMMMNSMEEVNAEENRLNKMWEENNRAKADMEIHYDLR
jgi:hypothetical protein